MRGRRRERLRVESRVHDTNLRSVGEQNRCQVGPTILLRAPRQDPPLLPSIIFPLGHAWVISSRQIDLVIHVIPFLHHLILILMS